MRESTILLVLAVLIWAAPALSQTQWTKYERNPVLDAGTDAGSWEYYGVAVPRILRVGDTLKMWYSGRTTLSGGGAYSIGYAWSTDGGVSWTKHANNPVFGPQLAWEGNVIFLADVVYDAPQYKMWYTGGPHGYHHLGYATSSDGIVWTRRSAPILDPGPLAWDNKTVAWPSILGPDNLGGYKMWYQGYPASVLTQIGYATAANETTWVKNETNPVLQMGSPGSWDDRRLEGPTVLYNGSYYEMWYNGERTNLFTDSQIGYATSPDGISWTKNSSNPVLRPGEGLVWDAVSVFTGDVLIEDGKYHMWYSGYDGSKLRIGYATALLIDGLETVTRLQPSEFSLSQNYPNPFNPSTTIQFSVISPEFTVLKIFDVLGQEVATLVSETLMPGRYQVTWDATGFPSGVYFCRLIGEGISETRRLVLMR